MCNPELFKAINSFLTMNDYTPISCSFYDILESIATKRELAVIEYFDETKQQMSVTGKIQNLFTQEKVEYMHLEQGLLIRLDNIIAVNGMRAGNYC